MKYLFFAKKSKQFLILLQLILIVLFSVTKSFATIGLTVNGQVNGGTFVQGGNFQWSITGLTNGAVTNNQLWVDLNNNGIIDPLSDLLFVSFSQTDGAAGGDNGPGDDDGVANGTITSSVPDLSFPAEAYIFNVVSGTDSITSTFTITPMPSPTFLISGRVTLGGTGKENVVVSVRQNINNNNSEYDALTDVNGYYTINTNLQSGLNIKIEIPFQSFNSALAGYISIPARYDTILNTNLYNINFQLIRGKIITGLVTDTLGNPIQDFNVNAYPQQNGGNGYDARTGLDGRYYLTTDTGTFTVQFGSETDTRGYIKTYYNQKYLPWLSDGVHVTALTDTIKNIDAMLRKGGLIKGTFKDNGVSVRGRISAYQYNVYSVNPLYEAWHDSNDSVYKLVLPPGTYTIQFQKESGGINVYYNQTMSSPGNPVTVNSIYDTAKNINVDFATVPYPHKFIFIGNGNWSQQFNWKDNIMPPPDLTLGDTIVIYHSPGGYCLLDVEQHISAGGILVVVTGKNLIIPGSLKLEQH